MATSMITYTKHAICESSKLKATTAGHIYNVEIGSNLDNGSVLALGDYLRPEVYEGVTPTTADKVVLVLQVPVIYEEYTTKMQAEYNFYNASGDIVRCYELEPRDIFSLTKEGFSGTPAKGKYVIASGSKLTVATAVTTENFVGKIVGVASNGAYLVEVIKNS